MCAWRKPCGVDALPNVKAVLRALDGGVHEVVSVVCPGKVEDEEDWEDVDGFTP